MAEDRAPEPANRRREPRLAIGLPVELERGNGWTRDVSASGVYFETDRSLSVGAPIEFSLVLAHAEPTVLRLQCVGRIVRMERQAGKVGVAATITASELSRQIGPLPPLFRRRAPGGPEGAPHGLGRKGGRERPSARRGLTDGGEAGGCRPSPR